MNFAIQEAKTELALEVEQFTMQERDTISSAMEILRSRFGSLTSASEATNGAAKAPPTVRRRQVRVAVRS
jgi:hypothetical protein